MKLNEKIIALRREKGMSQETLAEKLGVSRQAVSRWEQGTALPDSLNLLGLSKLFGVSADYLLNDDYKSDKDIPVASVVQSETKAEANRKTVFIVLSLFNVFLTVIYAVAPQMTALPLMGTTASVVLLVSFELGWRRAGGTPDSDGEKYHAAFYILSLWCVLFMPVLKSSKWAINIAFLLTKKQAIDQLPPFEAGFYGIVLPYILYAAVCIPLTVLIKKLSKPKK